MKKLQQTLNAEKKKYRELQKEVSEIIFKKHNENKHYFDFQVNKMAALMRDDEEEEVEEEEEKEEIEEAEEEETEEEETETESETSEEEESSDEEDEVKDQPLDKKKENLQNRAKRHENCLNALKKGNHNNLFLTNIINIRHFLGNYMLKTNVDRLQDDLNKQKEEVITLQEDLDSVLADLG